MTDIPNSRRSQMEHDRDMPDAQTDAPERLTLNLPSPDKVAARYTVFTGGVHAEYVRADLYDAAQTEIAKLRKRVEAADALADSCETYFESACDMTFVLKKLKAYRDTDAKP
jgi:hypothetical protein